MSSKARTSKHSLIAFIDSSYSLEEHDDHFVVHIGKDNNLQPYSYLVMGKLKSIRIMYPKGNKHLLSEDLQQLLLQPKSKPYIRPSWDDSVYVTIFLEATTVNITSLSQDL